MRAINGPFFYILSSRALETKDELTPVPGLDQRILLEISGSRTLNLSTQRPVVASRPWSRS